MFRRCSTLYKKIDSRSMSFMRNSFGKAFGKYLLLTNVVSSGVLLGVGDIIQQEVEYRQKKLSKRYDYSRTGRMMLVGFTLGPLHHYYYKYLDIFIPKSDVKNVVKKILFDLFLECPIVIMGFFYGMGILENKSFTEINQELRSKFMTIYTVDWIVWPPVQFLNFYFLNPKYRVLYINLITIAYDVFLSYIKHNDNHNIPNIIAK